MLTEKVREIIDNKDLATMLTLNTVKDYSWVESAKKYYEMIYSPLMEK